MKRRHRSRPIAALTALIFLLLGAGDAFGLRSCPHHEGAAHGHAAEPTPAHADHPPHEDSSTDAPAAGHEPCSCAGYCPTGTTIGPAPDPDLAHAPRNDPEAPASVPPVDSPLLRFTPFFLPYSQAPPADR